jgi:hypothetical protein
MSWTCSRCETINPETADVCEVCDTERIAKRSRSTTSRSKKEEYSAFTTAKSSESTSKPSPLAWILAVVFGVTSFILFMTNSSQNQELQSLRNQSSNYQAEIDSAVANAESNIRHSMLGLNYYRVTLSDFYNAKTYPINNVNGEQIGELYITYGWAFMENDKPIDMKSLVTTRVIFNIYSESTNGYYGFSTSMQDKYDAEERHIPSIGSIYYAETSNYKMAIRVIDYKKDQESSGWDEPAFGTLTLDIVISNK